ncbi:MAG: flagellar P-ring protein FlgI [Thermotogaceae bacterium]|jgi:flagellar P-ring protein precursor FlgI|nr:flagellar P-ring protein FlgI [Thermotogaceae bacterium]
MKKRIAVFIIIALLVVSSFGALVRLKDIARFRGARDNQLFGVGLIVGLDGTGDSGTIPSSLLSNMLNNFGITAQAAQLQSNNNALVMVTANIPAFYKNGMRLDVVVSAIGDASSLENGVLIQTPLYGADGVVYAVAQGQVSLGGQAINASINLQQRFTTVGTVPGGAIIEKEIPTEIVDSNTLTLLLLNPDFTTSARTAQALNTKFDENIARAVDSSSVKISIPEIFRDDLITFLSIIEEVEVVPDVVARVIINERTGTVVLGGDVKVDDFTVSYGGFSVTIDNGRLVEGENPAGESSIRNLVAGLKAIGAKPQDIIAILTSLKESGVLHAELVLM